MAVFKYVTDTTYELRQGIIDAADEAAKNEQWITLNNLFNALDTVTDLYIYMTRTEYEQQIADLKKELEGVKRK